MIYVEMLGRMGNQMFSYAFARKLQLQIKRQQKSKIAFDFSKVAQDWSTELTEFVCDDNIILQERKLCLLQRAALYLYFRRRNRLAVYDEVSVMKLEEKWQLFLNLFGIYLCSFNFHKFWPNPLFKNLLVLGFYESPAFFEDIDQLLQEEFSLKEKNNSDSVQQLVNQVVNCESVCVAVRRGDFESSGLRDFCSVCNEQYFFKAIKQMKEVQDNSKFFFFSDDIEWVRTKLAESEECVIVDPRSFGLSPAKQFQIMVQCKHFIISNSTYIWWTQHLCRNPEKKVIAPTRWRNFSMETHTGIYEKQWILVDPD